MSTTELPLRIVSVANLREHWTATAKRAQTHRNAAIAVPRHSLPCVVTLVRIAPRPLDDDNLRSAFKATRDGIADRLGVKDNDPRVTWAYGQERGQPKQYAARVTIEALAAVGGYMSNRLLTSDELTERVLATVNKCAKDAGLTPEQFMDKLRKEFNELLAMDEEE